MGIKYITEKQIFHLDTQNTTYLIGLSPEGYIGHIYYGQRLKSEGSNYLFRMQEPPYTPSVHGREKA